MNARSFQAALGAPCEKGQMVRIRDVIWSRWAGQTGIIVEVKPNQRGKRVLDKYVIRFADNDQEEFWGIQLETDLPDQHKEATSLKLQCILRKEREYQSVPFVFEQTAPALATRGTSPSNEVVGKMSKPI